MRDNVQNISFNDFSAVIDFRFLRLYKEIFIICYSHAAAGNQRTTKINNVLQTWCYGSRIKEHNLIGWNES